MRKTRYRWLFVVLAAIFLVAALAACGGGGSSSSSSSSGEEASSSTTSEETGGSGEESSGGSDAEIKEEAAALTAKAETPPPKVPEAELPLKNKNIPTGKTVAFLGCGAEQCEEYFGPIQEGAEALGWSAKLYQGSVEPNKIVKYFEEIVASKPDVFIACCVAPSIAGKYLNELKDEGTISVMCCTQPEGTEGLTKLLSVPEDKLIAGENAANFMLAEKGEELHVLYVNSEDFEVSKQYAEGLKGQVEKLCSSCTVDEIQAAVEDIGKPAISTAVVSYLRSHPEINYVSTLFSPLLIGVPAAMKAAGLEIPITSTASGAIALEDVKTGKEGWKAVQNFGIEWGLQGLNIAVRTMMKEPLGEETLTPEVLVTEKNAAKVSPGSGNQPVIPDALQQYEEIWGV
jgi:ABC-type sugar transport system substrate-binding protein